IGRSKTVLVIQDSTRQYYPICLEYDSTNTTVAKFKFTIDFDQAFLDCMSTEAEKDSFLVNYAVEKLLDSAATAFYKSYRTDCFRNINEKLQYQFIPKEYHYTLYYFDQ